MRTYSRTTRTCAPAAIPGALLGALRDYAAVHGLGDPTTTVVSCCITNSTWAPGLLDRLFGRSTARETLALVTPDMLFHVVADAGSTTGVALGFRLELLEVRPFGEVMDPAHVVERGVAVTGFRAGGGERVSTHIPLGPGVDADAFEHALREAIERRRLGTPDPLR
jgi:hypothetical protein